MQTFTTVLIAFSAISTVSSSPINFNHLFARDTCGSAPSASGSQTPLSQPSNIQNAQACQSACTSNPQCQSFLFGLVDSSIKCMLFSVPASQVPKQSSQNLVAYDKACGSVPAVTPTSSNPTGAASGSNNSGNNNNNNGGNNNQNQQGGQQTNPPTGGRLAVRDTCGAAPAGSNANQAPLSQPANIQSEAECLAKCKADGGCKSFEFGTENGKTVCKLFSVAAAEVPAPQNGQSFKVFDAGCSV